jgi:hypothetical protein
MTSTIGGGPYLATHYWGGTDSQAEADAAVAAVGAFWGAVDNVMDSQITWATEPEVAILGVDGVVTGSLTTTPQTGSGAIASDSMPLASQALVRWFTPNFIGGRRLRGRTFIPGITTAGNTNGRLASATSTTIGTAATTLANVATPLLVVWSRIHGVAHPVSSASVWAEFASLRSRRD